jgi:hypothetical protein
VAEAALKHGRWTAFSRGEITENRELVDTHEGHGAAYRVGKLSLGVGGLFAVNFVPAALEAAYGSRQPLAAMGFVRLQLD